MNQRSLRKSADQWEKIIADFDQSGLSASDYCEQHRLVLTTFRKWKQRFSANTMSVLPVPGFVPVQRSEPVAQTHSCVQLQIGSSITLTIRLEGAEHES